MDDVIELPEVEVRPIGLTLQTFYPITSKQYPWTGHSQLKVVKKENNIGGPGFTMSLGSENKGYNLITNNCSDYTRKGLEAITGKKVNPWFFTTPGDVQDFFINNFNVVKNLLGLVLILIGQLFLKMNTKNYRMFIMNRRNQIWMNLQLNCVNVE